MINMSISRQAQVKECSGFSLIELIIVIAIIGILASVAYASYSSSIQKSRRADGKEALGRIAALQEQFYIQRNQYSEEIAELGGSSSVEGNYTMSVVFDSMSGTGCSDGACFTATAVATGVQAEDDMCLVLTIDSLGRKEAWDSIAKSNETTDTCW